MYKAQIDSLCHHVRAPFSTVVRAGPCIGTTGFWAEEGELELLERSFGTEEPDKEFAGVSGVC